MLEKGKISVRQTGLLFIITAMTMLIRLPGLLAGNTGKASWLVPIAAAALFLPVLFAVKVLFAKDRFESLSDAYTGIFGKAVSAVISVITLLVALMLMVDSLSAVITREVTSVTPSMPVGLLAGILLAIVLFISRGGLTPLARTAEFTTPFLIVVIGVVLLLSLPSVKLNNVYPIVPNDVPKVFEYSHIVFAALGLFIMTLSFSDQTVNPKGLYKMGGKCAAFLCLFAVLVVFAAFGTLGENIVGKTSEPFFSVVKSISVFNTLERLDSLVLPIWVIADVISIAVYAHMAAHIIRSLTGYKNTKSLAFPIVIVCFLAIIFLYETQYLFTWTFNVIIVPALILVSFVVPLLALAVGKLRKIV